MAKRTKAASTETSNAGSAKATKADLIRAAAKEIGKPVRPRDIVAALKAKGVTVGYTQIAKALKAGGFHRKRSRRKVAAATANGAASHSVKVNKAERIRQTAKALGKKFRPKDIIAALAKEGIHVSSAQVSTTLIAAGYRRRKIRSGAAAGKAFGKTSGRGLDIEALIATKALIQKIGSIEAAEEAIRALKRLA
jgi:lambda repressor-like predicted transcriptional regulator